MRNPLEPGFIIAMLYERYYDTLMKSCIRNLIGDVPLLSYAEDIVQETFIEAIQKWDEIAHFDSHIGWLINTSKNKIDNLKSKHYRRQKLHAFSLDDSLEQVVEDRDIRIERVFEKKEAREHLDNILAILTDVEEDAVINHYEDGMTVPEMAEVAQTTEGSQRSALRRGRKKALRYRNKNFFIIILFFMVPILKSAK